MGQSLTWKLYFLFQMLSSPDYIYLSPYLLNKIVIVVLSDFLCWMCPTLKYPLGEFLEKGYLKSIARYSKKGLPQLWYLHAPLRLFYQSELLLHNIFCWHPSIILNLKISMVKGETIIYKLCDHLLIFPRGKEYLQLACI